jgi:hypothetical protein
MSVSRDHCVFKTLQTDLFTHSRSLHISKPRNVTLSETVDSRRTLSIISNVSKALVTLARDQPGRTRKETRHACPPSQELQQQ